MNIQQEIISAYASTRIPECSNNIIRSTFVEIYSLIGISKYNYPDEEIESHIFRFLRENLFKFTIGDLSVAFNLAAMGMISGIDIGKYQTFSSSMIYSVLNAYDVQHRSKVVAEFCEKLITEKCELTKEQVENKNYEAARRGCINSYIEYTEKNIFEINLLKSRYYDFLESLKLLPLNINKNKYMDDARDLIIKSKKDELLRRRELSEDQRMKIKNSIKNITSDLFRTDVIETAKALVVLDCFKKWSESKLNISDLIKESETSGNQ